MPVTVSCFPRSVMHFAMILAIGSLIIAVFGSEFDSARTAYAQEFGQPSAGQSASARPGEAPEQAVEIKDDVELMNKALSELPEEIRADAQQAWDQFEESERRLAAAMLEFRKTQLHYRNGLDQSPAAIVRFREQRSEVWELMQKQFTHSLDLLRFLPSMEAASYIVTMVQHHFETDIYDAETFEGAARLLDMGQNLRFLFLAAARSAVVSGDFESAKKIYETLQEEDLEKADLPLKYQLEQLEEQWKREQEAIKSTDSESLPQVRFETTQGNFLVELFPESAPSAVAHFLKLVEDGFYDGMDFSVVSNNLLALTGDVTGDGRGNSGQFLVDEHKRDAARPALRGSLAMAKLPLGEGEFVENSGSSQFAILYLPIVSLPDSQTVFGRVIEGMDTVSRLRRVDPTAKKEKTEIQLPPDAIIGSEIVRPGKDLAEPFYVDLQAEFDKALEAGLIRRKTSEEVAPE